MDQLDLTETHGDTEHYMLDSRNYKNMCAIFTWWKLVVNIVDSSLFILWSYWMGEFNQKGQVIQSGTDKLTIAFNHLSVCYLQSMTISCSSEWRSSWQVLLKLYQEQDVLYFKVLPVMTAVIFQQICCVCVCSLCVFLPSIFYAIRCMP